MSKYKNTLNMHSHNSASAILREIRSNTRVLEFGASNGYMTQYLKENCKCEVSIIELDEEDGKQASQWAVKSFIGADEGNIENYKWTNIDPVDHIIFADVLEHLYNPENVLKESLKVLKENGTILFSIPNISHNSIIIDLFNDNFEYRELGLLDNTHIRFFTEKSLRKMIEKLGLKVSKEMNTYCNVGRNEINNNLTDVPSEVAAKLLERKNGTLYQFIWELRK